MNVGTKVESVVARQVYTERGYPGIEVTVTTANDAKGVAICAAGVSIGEHEVAFLYDGGEKWRGKGVLKAVERVNTVIADGLKGQDATKQLAIDSKLFELRDAHSSQRLGGNATAAVSAAVLKAGAASLNLSLYQHIGGVNACVLPVPGVMAVIGSLRYGAGKSSGQKPSYSFVCYGFDTFSDASYAAWDVGMYFTKIMSEKFGLEARQDFAVIVPPGKVKHDRELWELMTKAIDERGYTERIGIQVDIAASTYFDAAAEKFIGLFSAEPKTKSELCELYQDMVRQFPFVIFEDPLVENDFEGHSALTSQLGIQIVGDDLFTTNPERLSEGLDAANAVLLKVNQIGTISQAFEFVRLAQRSGYAVVPCSSRGEGADIADYAVGLNSGQLREGAIGATGNRLLKIEMELGPRATFLGKRALKPQ